MIDPHLKFVNEGDFISATEYNKLVAICRALVKGEGRGGIKFSIAEGGMVWDGRNISGSSESGDEGGGSGNISFRGRWDVATTYNTDDIVTMVADTDYGIAGTYISLADSNTGNTPPIGPSTSTAWWQTLAKSNYTQFVVGEIDYPQVQYPAQTAYTFIDKNDIFIQGATGHGYMEDGTTPVTASAVINPDSGIAFSGQRNTYSFLTNHGYDDYPLEIEPIKLSVCINGETKYLWVLGMLSDT